MHSLIEFYKRLISYIFNFKHIYISNLTSSSHFQTNGAAMLLTARIAEKFSKLSEGDVIGWTQNFMSHHDNNDSDSSSDDDFLHTDTPPSDYLLVESYLYDLCLRINSKVW